MSITRRGFLRRVLALPALVVVPSLGLAIPKAEIGEFGIEDLYPVYDVDQKHGMMSAEEAILQQLAEEMVADIDKEILRIVRNA